jgi:hypothetical protein
MTNHPRSPRAKFKVGQVVADKLNQCFVKILARVPVNEPWKWDYRVDKGDTRGTHTYLQFGIDLRPLTKKEAGR